MEFTAPLSLLVAVYLVYFVCVTSGSTLVRREITAADEPYAVCNDGTRAAYHHSDNREGATKFVIYLMGGFFCDSIDACIVRCVQNSPDLCTATRQATYTSRLGILTDDVKDNYLFADYYKVRLHYCTSDMYIGRKNASSETGLFHFQGRAVIAGLVNSLKRHAELERATEVILTGTSAGGRGAAFSCEYLRTLLPDSISLRCVVDATMFYPNVSAYTPTCTHFNDLIRNANRFWDGPITDFDVATWWSELSVPLFIGYETQDTYGHQYYCVQRDDEEQYQRWGDQVVELARTLVRRSPHVGLYLAACQGHVMITNRKYSRLPAGPQQLTYQQTLENWMNNQEGKYHTFDDCGEDSGQTCNPYCNVDPPGETLANGQKITHIHVINMALLMLPGLLIKV